jgi:hypothetical protein
LLSLCELCASAWDSSGLFCENRDICSLHSGSSRPKYDIRKEFLNWSQAKPMLYYSYEQKCCQDRAQIRREAVRRLCWRHSGESHCHGLANNRRACLIKPEAQCWTTITKRCCSA